MKKDIFSKIKDYFSVNKKKDKKEKKKFSIVNEINEWITAFVVAAVVYFIILPLFLGTSAPMVIVPSCSEKGYLNVGDIVFVKGTQIKDLKAPFVELDKFIEMKPIEENGVVEKIQIGDTVIKANSSNDIIVYIANPSGSQIIHRVFGVVKIQDEYFALTKGDNNAIPDQVMMSGSGYITCFSENHGSCISSAITQDRLMGKKILFRIPLLGHVKLFFCDVMPFCEGHSNLGNNYQYTLTC